MDWLWGRLVYGKSLRSWIPDGFERYARVLHPAHVWNQAEDHVYDRSVPWSQISAWSGKPLRAASSINDLSVREDGTSWQRRGTSLPLEGQLEWPLLDRMTDVLAEATSTPGLLWLLVWHGDVGPAAPNVPLGRRGRRRSRRSLDDLGSGAVVDISPSLTDSGRRYLLFRGSIEIPSDRFAEPVLRTPPSFWWPEDRAWFVSTDIDSTSTYIAGSAELIGQLLDDRRLEVFVADVDDPYDGDPRGP